MTKNKPQVSIGMPIYNAEKYLKEAIESLLSQSFKDFELIISDNASTDSTHDICMEYAKKDHRIRYVRQSQNIGAWSNFQYVLDESQADYFMWAAHDDFRSIDYLELNYVFLSTNLDYVASTCPNQFEASHQDVSFSMKENDDFKRYMKFFDHCWFSHGIFYSLIRRKILIECVLIEEKYDFLGIDWGVDIFLASKGKINLSDKGYTFFNEGGSKNRNHLKRVRSNYIEFFIPFYKLSNYVIKITQHLSLIERAKILNILILLNMKLNLNRFKSNLKHLIRFKSL